MPSAWHPAVVHVVSGQAPNPELGQYVQLLTPFWSRLLSIRTVFEWGAVELAPPIRMPAGLELCAVPHQLGPIVLLTIFHPSIECSDRSQQPSIFLPTLIRLPSIVTFLDVPLPASVKPAEGPLRT